MKTKYYYWWWEKIITSDMIKHINKCKPIVDQNLPAGVKRTSKVVFFPYKKIKPYLNNAIEHCYESNKNNFHYDLFNFDENQNIHQNIYSSKNKGEYDWHIDSNDDFQHDIKFTVLINISQKKYEGGEFILMSGSKPVYVKELSVPGNMVMFRSNLLHKVNQVTKGERKTLTFFLDGPNFK
tara:strand:+ start:1062 stop:1604 length:543 start_codon:yes stop_codon:yes gene_type:complete